MTDTNGSSQLQWAHCMTQPSSSAKLATPQGKHVLNKDKKHCTEAVREENEKKKSETILQPLRPEKKEGKDVLHGRDHSGEDNPAACEEAIIKKMEIS